VRGLPPHQGAGNERPDGARGQAPAPLAVIIRSCPPLVHAGTAECVMQVPFAPLGLGRPASSSQAGVRGSVPVHGTDPRPGPGVAEHGQHAAAVAVGGRKAEVTGGGVCLRLAAPAGRPSSPYPTSLTRLPRGSLCPMFEAAFSPVSLLSNKTARPEGPGSPLLGFGLPSLARTAGRGVPGFSVHL
jgi:hypothetical protein